MSHETAASEIGRLEKKRQSTAMVQMEMADEQQVDFTGHSDIEKRQGSFACHSRVDTAIEHNLLPLILEHNTRPTDFLASPKRLNDQLIALLRWHICCSPFRRPNCSRRHHV